MSGLSIKDPETVELVRRTAQKSHLSMTQLVKRAVQSFVDESDRESESVLSRVRDRLDAIRDLPGETIFSRSDLYDERGLPR